MIKVTNASAAKAAVAPEKKRYTVLKARPIYGQRPAVGSEIELVEAQAKYLVMSGVLAEVEDATPVVEIEDAQAAASDDTTDAAASDVTDAASGDTTDAASNG